MTGHLGTGSRSNGVLEPRFRVKAFLRLPADVSEAQSLRLDMKSQVQGQIRRRERSLEPKAPYAADIHVFCNSWRFYAAGNLRREQLCDQNGI
jgi:hypothetical protein